VKDPSTDLIILMDCSNHRIGGKVVHRFVKSLLGSRKIFFEIIEEFNVNIIEV
jgi:hypothetical protein